MSTTKTKSRSERWRYYPITHNQMALMDQMSIPYRSSMTRGEASDLITEEQEHNPECDSHPFDLDDF